MAATSTAEQIGISDSVSLNRNLKMKYVLKSREYVYRTGFWKSRLPSGQDRWVALPAIVAFIVPLLVSLAADFSWDLYPTVSIASLSLFIDYLLSPFVGVASSLWFLLNFRWRRSFSFAALPIFFFMQFGYPHVGPIDISKYVYFFSRKAAYEKELTASDAGEEPQMMWFFWRDGSSMFGQVLIYIVYDGSDEFAKPNVQRSVEWSSRARRSYTAATGYQADMTMPDEADHLIGHYYVVALDE